MKKVLIPFFLITLLFIAFTVPAFADSPITSTNFYKAYTDVGMVNKALAAKGVMNSELAQFLALPGNTIDVKATVVNALYNNAPWEVRNNGELYSELTYGKPLSGLDMDALSGDQLLCIGYLLAIDDYFHPDKAVPILEKASAKMGDSFTAAMITAIVKTDAQELGADKSKDNYVEKVVNNKALNQDLRPGAQAIIIDCIGLPRPIAVPASITVEAGKSANVYYTGGKIPYGINNLSDKAAIAARKDDSGAHFLNVTGVKYGTLELPIYDDHGSAAWLYITVASSEAQRRLGDSVVLYTGSSYAYVDNEKTAIDVSDLQVKPIVKNERTLVPVRFISENLGAKVEWDSKTSTARISMGENTVNIVPGSSTMSINGVDSLLEVPAESINSRLYIPLRALVEALGKKVFFNNGLIIISNSENILDVVTEKYLVDEIIARFDSSNPSVKQDDSYAGLFPDGLAPAKMDNGKYGYVDRSGKTIIKPQFDDAKSFSDGVAEVSIGGKQRYIDKNGNFVISFGAGDIYIGGIKDGKRNGKGTYTWQYGAQYNGEWKDDVRNGKGTMAYADGSAYTGDWSNDRINGQGIMTYTNGDEFTGQWENEGRLQGTYTWADGSRYTGSWKNGSRNGQGKMIYANGKVDDGSWVDDVFKGATQP